MVGASDGFVAAHNSQPCVVMLRGRAMRSNVVKGRVGHLEGGVFGWYNAGLPFQGEYNTANVGRTPNAAQDAQYPVGGGAPKK